MPERTLDLEGVERERYCNPHTTLENCHALQLYFKPYLLQLRRSVIVWRGRTKHTRLAEPSVRLRDLRPGDYVIYCGQQERLTRVEIYR